MLAGSEVLEKRRRGGLCHWTHWCATRLLTREGELRRAGTGARKYGPSSSDAAVNGGHDCEKTLSGRPCAGALYRAMKSLGWSSTSLAASG